MPNKDENCFYVLKSILHFDLFVNIFTLKTENKNFNKLCQKRLYITRDQVGESIPSWVYFATSWIPTTS